MMRMFTVIMPVYNHADYIRDAVQSVIDQTFDDWELIIIDDGSTDGSEKIVDELSKNQQNITVLHQQNAGPAAARNHGIKHSNAKWMTYIDSDDLWYPDALQNYASHIREHPDVKFLYGFRDRLDEKGTITKLKGEFQDTTTGTRELFGRMYLSHLCVCYRRELLEQAGGYDENLRTCEDYELYLRISQHCSFDPLAKATGLRRRHGTNISRQTGRTRAREAEVLRRFIERLGGDEIIEPQRVSRRLGRLYYTSARQYFKARCYRQAINVLRKANRYNRSVKGTLIGLFSRILLPLGTTDGHPVPEL